MGTAKSGIVRALCGLAVILTAYGCTDETIVFRDRELFETPNEAALGMIGYSDQDASLTVCGNCHVGPQLQWEETGHADAWAGLQDSGHAQAFCEGCHTVSELGNVLTEAAGWNTTPETRYHDVQCESCHGPGLLHVQNPTDLSVPNASMTVGVDATQGCAECHQGTHHPFTEQWEESAHSNLIGFAAARPGCTDCHSGNGALIAWGERTTYQEEGENFSITCAVCHDPHGSEFEADLRWPVANVAVEQNLCSQCHNRRTVPDPNSSHGLHPHSPQTGLMIGDVGWFPPGLVIDRREIIASHGSEGNERLCATCHVATKTFTDPSTGDFVFSGVGHGFNAIPCSDENGLPTTGDCEMSTTARDFETGCAASGCHTTAETAFSALATSTVRLQALAEEIHELLAVIDPNGEDSGGEIDSRDGAFTVAEGAYFNMELAEFGGTGRPDERLAFASAAAHNPFLTEQLLIASIQALEDTYGVQASPGLSLVREIVSGR